MSPNYVPDYSECTLPYVKWYQDDFLGGVRGMKAAEVGVYTVLLMEMYARGEALNMSNDRLARLCGIDKRAFLDILEMLIEEGKIIRLNCGLWNERCENAFRSRTKMFEVNSEAGKKSAEKRNKNNGKIQRPFNDRSTTVQPSSEAQIYNTSSVPSLVCSEPKNSPPSQPEKKVAIELLATKNEVVKITFDEARQWQADFPAVDVPQQLREIRSWLGANPSRRKTARGMRRFIVTWLGKEQDKGGFGKARTTGPTTIAGAAAAALEEKRNDQFSFDAMEREQGQSVGRSGPALPPLKFALPKLPE